MLQCCDALLFPIQVQVCLKEDKFFPISQLNWLPVTSAELVQEVYIGFYYLFSGFVLFFKDILYSMLKSELFEIRLLGFSFPLIATVVFDSSKGKLKQKLSYLMLLGTMQIYLVYTLQSFGLPLQNKKSQNEEQFPQDSEEANCHKVPLKRPFNTA